MDFRTILTFIAIAFLSSLFNKNKTSTKPPVNTGKGASQGSLPKNTVPGTDRNERKNFSGGLEDLFKEMRSEFDKNFRESQKEQTRFPAEQSIREKDDVKAEQDSPSLNSISEKDIRKVTGSVYDGEIGKETYIKFNKKSIIQGVIMSEILQKPKSLKR